MLQHENIIKLLFLFSADNDVKAQITFLVLPGFTGAAFRAVRIAITAGAMRAAGYFHHHALTQTLTGIPAVVTVVLVINLVLCLMHSETEIRRNKV